jgi:hypothetical protein
MFLGEALCLLIYFVKEFVRRRREAAANDYHTLSGGGHGRDVSPRLSAVNQLTATSSFTSPEPVSSVGGAAVAAKPPVWVYAILCCFDLGATSVGGVGLVWVDASTNQMLRGSMVVFCAIFSVLMLKRKLSNPQWGSIGLVCVGLGLVGLSGMLKKKYSPDASGDSTNVSSGQLLIGILLVLLASALNAVQNVFEEKLLKAVGGAEVDPLELVGWEGIFGTILSAFLLLPVVYYIPGDDCGRAEDSLNTMEQLKNSPMAIMLSLSFIVSLCLMNWTSQQISQQLSAVHRNLVSAVRTVLVWVGSLILFYTTKNDDVVYGEQWTNWSLMELSGFFVLVAGTILYSYFGLQLAKLAEETAAAAKNYPFEASPEYALPIEPALGEHSQIIKQQNRHASYQQRNGADSYGQSVYDEDQ